MNLMRYKAYSDSYLMSLTKPQIIELLRVAEHNFFATEEALNNSAKAGTEIAEKFDKAKELLKSAVEDMSEKNFCAKVCKKDNFACRVSDTCDFKWRYADEALKIIEERRCVK